MYLNLYNDIIMHVSIVLDILLGENYHKTIGQEKIRDAPLKLKSRA